MNAKSAHQKLGHIGLKQTRKYSTLRHIINISFVGIRLFMRSTQNKFHLINSSSGAKIQTKCFRAPLYPTT